MNLKSQVASLELCEKLKELGINQQSLFYWHNGKLACPDFQEYNIVPSNWISAFTVAELIEMLPCTIQQTDDFSHVWTGRLRIEKLAFKYWVYYYEKHDNFWEFVDESLANSLAKMLIRLIENGLMPEKKDG